MAGPLTHQAPLGLPALTAHAHPAVRADLANAVEHLATGGHWKPWLDVAARFHTHPADNTILIWHRRPDATLLAGAEAWKRAGRRIINGEQPIRLLSSSLTTAEHNPAHGRGTAGDEFRANRDRITVHPRPTTAWDVTQTIGDPLPNPPRTDIGDDNAVDDLWDDLVDQLVAHRYELRRGFPRHPRATGYTDFVLRTVTIRTDLTQPQAVTVLAHELGHIALHDPHTTGKPLRPCCDLVQDEADSVSYLIAAAHGIDTSCCTFPYLDGLAAVHALGPHRTDVVHQAATRVLAAAHDILDKLGHQPARLEPPAHHRAAGHTPPIQRVAQQLRRLPSGRPRAAMLTAATRPRPAL